MLRLIIILVFSSALFSQVQTESWLDYVIEENKEEISETSSVNIDNEFYYTIQIAVKKTFETAVATPPKRNAIEASSALSFPFKSAALKLRFN